MIIHQIFGLRTNWLISLAYDYTTQSYASSHQVITSRLIVARTNRKLSPRGGKRCTMTIISAGWSKDRRLFKIDARVSIVPRTSDLDLDDRPSPPLPRENSVNHRNQLIRWSKGSVPRIRSIPLRPISRADLRVEERRLYLTLQGTILTALFLKIWGVVTLERELDFLSSGYSTLIASLLVISELYCDYSILFIKKIHKKWIK